MPWAPGDALWLPTGSKNHIFVALNAPKNFTGYAPDSVILVCICSEKAGCDTTCMLSPPIHPQILHNSYVAFEFTRIETEKTLDDLVSKGTGVRLASFPVGEIAKFVAGLSNSKRARGAFKLLAKDL